jgi:hypothetical protein
MLCHWKLFNLSTGGAQKVGFRHSKKQLELKDEEKALQYTPLLFFFYLCR